MERRNDTAQKERIVEHAMQMFAAQGIKSVRMDDIASQLGVSKRTLYELFGDKEQLLYLAIVRFFAHNRARWRAYAETTDNVIEHFFFVQNDMLEQGETASRMLGNLKKFYPEVYARLLHEGTAKNREEMRAMLLRGIGEGLFEERLNIELAIELFYYMASAFPRRELPIPEGMNAREAFIRVASTFFRGISTPKGVQLVDTCTERYLERMRNLTQE